MGWLVEARSSETNCNQPGTRERRIYCRRSSQKKSSELIKSELVYDETARAASDSSFDRLGCVENEGIKNKPRARGLHAAESPGHLIGAMHGW